jgi:hypothetical protein
VVSPTPPNQPRVRALADLGASITKAEETVEARRLALERVVAEGGDARRALALLRIANHRLAQLRASRRVLLEGEVGDEAARRHAEAAKRWRRRRKASSDGAEEDG